MARGTVKKGISVGIVTTLLGIFIAFGLDYVRGVKKNNAVR